MATCYAITEGEYSDYRVLAVFSTKELAEKELPKYGGDAEIEEFPFDPEIPEPPTGMTGYRCYSSSDGSASAFFLSLPQMAEYASMGKLGDVQADPRGRCYIVIIWARDKDHAIKIAAEKFARQKAIDAGIAC